MKGYAHLPSNIFAHIRSHLPDEDFSTLLEAPGLRIERILSHGHASPPGFWHDEEHAEWVVVLRGSAKLLFEGDAESIEMKAGAFVDIPRHKRHRVEWTTPDEPTVWLAVHYDDRR